jgi:hypothetical protein
LAGFTMVSLYLFLCNILLNAEILQPLTLSNLTQILYQWKRINRKQSARWQHLSWLKASAFFSLQKKFS